MATTWLLPEVVGLAVARDLLLTGRAVTGADAVGIGLVNGTFPAETFLDDGARGGSDDRVPGAGGDPADQAGAGRRRARQLRGGAGLGGVAQPVTMATEDAREGVRAQRERRPARFTGR